MAVIKNPILTARSELVDKAAIEDLRYRAFEAARHANHRRLTKFRRHNDFSKPLRWFWSPVVLRAAGGAPA